MKGIEASEVSDSDTTQSQGPISSATTGSPEPKANTRTEDYGREKNRKTLAGLQGVQVIVEDFSPEAEKYGFNKQQYKTDVELRLRQYGVKVLSEEERLQASGRPCLYINVNSVIEEKIGIATVNIFIQLMEDVLLERNPSISVTAGIWHKGFTLSVRRQNLDKVRDRVKDKVDEFINDYLAANPKDQQSKKDSTTKTTQQKYVVPKNALIDMHGCAGLLKMASDPNRPQEQKAEARKRGLELLAIQSAHIFKLGIKPVDIEARGSILTKGDIKDMPPEVFDYINFNIEDFLNRFWSLP